MVLPTPHALKKIQQYTISNNLITNHFLISEDIWGMFWKIFLYFFPGRASINYYTMKMA